MGENNSERPLVGLPATVRSLGGGMWFHGSGNQYINAAVSYAGVLPVTIPAFDDPEFSCDVLEKVDGILLSGSYSCIDPQEYGGAPCDKITFDHQRDKNSLPLIRAAVEKSVPILGLCRGLQEINVALGGTLFTNITENPNLLDHLPPEHEQPEVHFAPAHDIEILPGGILQKLTSETTVQVNTSHMQAIDKVAESLRVEAVASDGIIEAVSVDDASQFVLGVQFHPEWGAENSILYRSIFEAFGNAVSAFHNKR